MVAKVINNGGMVSESGWVSYTSGDNSHLPDDVRRQVEERMKERQERQGGLLAIVQVHVYEHGALAGVGFPHGALLGVETEPSVISEVVARARDELANWQ